MFVQRMPVTKVVNEITIGDLALGPGCSVGTANAKIEEYENREIGGSGGVFYSSSPQPLTSTPSKITWAFSPLTFRKDRGYAIRVSMIGGCSSFNQTTWAHNEPRVNPGQLRCAKGPQGWRRMWHEMGTDDRLAGCVDPPPGQGIFDPSMPTGWLISQIGQNGSGIWDVRKFSTASTPVCNTPNPPNTYEQYGGTPIFWRSSLSFPYNPEYTCRWTQWADFGEQPQDGWYYAQPWLAERAGAPRDMYLKLDTIDYDDLLEAHAPVLAFDADENFYPQEAGALTDFADPPPGGYVLSSEYVNVLYDDDGEELAAAGSPGPENGPWPPAMALSVLGDHYWFGPDPPDQPQAAPTDYIDARGSSESTYSADSMAQYTAGYDDMIYGRVVHDPDDGQLWLQYWFFYYFNSFDVLGVGHHEGDWEMVQVGLNGSFAAQKMTYAAHNGAYRLGWANVVKDGVGSTRPVVYVAARSHASYPEPGETEVVWILATDHHQGDGLEKASMPVEEIDSGTRWTHWPGRWGSSLDGSTPSPKTPMEQGDKWLNPSAFHDAADEW
jgi:hypothetical protein